MTKTIHITSAFLVIFMLGLFLFVSPSLGTEPPMKKAKTATLKIMTTEGATFTVKEQKFTVDANTDIRDRFGRKIPLHVMWVPCKAEIEYVVSRGMEYRCLSIKVKEELDKDSVPAEMKGEIPR